MFLQEDVKRWRGTLSTLGFRIVNLGISPLYGVVEFMGGTPVLPQSDSPASSFLNALANECSTDSPKDIHRKKTWSTDTALVHQALNRFTNIILNINPLFV